VIDTLMFGFILAGVFVFVATIVVVQVVRWIQDRQERKQK